MIAEKLQMIAENEPKIYEAGKAEGNKTGYTSGYSKGKTDGYEEGKSEGIDIGYSDGLATGVQQGRDEEHEEFWENALKGTGWQNRFSGVCWNDKTFRPTKDIKPTGFADGCFAMCNITDMVAILEECGVTLDTSGVTGRADSFFNYCYYLKTVPYLDFSNVTASQGLNYLFTYDYDLETVEGLRLRDDGTLTLSNAFYQCESLKNIVIEGVIGQSFGMSTCTKLSKDSIISIMTHLSDTATGMKSTFSAQAIRSAFNIPTDADIETSEEWMAIRNTKLNWTVAYA